MQWDAPLEWLATKIETWTGRRAAVQTMVDALGREQGNRQWQQLIDSGRYLPSPDGKTLWPMGSYSAWPRA